MSDLLLTSVEYGGYISITKFVIFLVLFFLWLPLINWVYKDAKAVGAKEVYWTVIILAAGATAIIWMLIPVFIVGMLLYLIAVAAASISYVMHRNTMVPDFDRILTIEHIKGLFTSESKGLDDLSNLVFITANNNEVPVPQPKTPDFFGYKTACDILTDAARRRASDVIFSPTPQNYNLIYVVDGAALKQPDIPREQTEYFIHFTKNLADLDVNEKRKPQKGTFTLSKGREHSEWEVATSGSTAGEEIRLKHITQHNIIKLTDLNLPSNLYEQLNKIRESKQGLFIVAGPKKSGTTTTFYALLRNHDPFIYSISTLEKQPAAELQNITQNIFTLSDTGTATYAEKLQTIVRMGPNVVGLADCRDSQTAKTACDAAKNGKIIYVTLEAENVTKALGRWLKLVGDRNLAVDNLLGISSQRLLRKLCNDCKEAYEPNKQLLNKFNIPAEKVKVFYRPGKVQYSRHGRASTCEKCQGTGFVGRMGIFEIIIINNELRNAIKQSKSLSQIAAQFRRAKMLYLQEQALKNVVAGKTAINEMIRVFATSKNRKPEQKS